MTNFSFGMLDLKTKNKRRMKMKKKKNRNMCTNLRIDNNVKNIIYISNIRSHVYNISTKLFITTCESDLLKAIYKNE